MLAFHLFTCFILINSDILVFGAGRFVTRRILSSFSTGFYGCIDDTVRYEVRLKGRYNEKTMHTHDRSRGQILLVTTLEYYQYQRWPTSSTHFCDFFLLRPLLITSGLSVENGFFSN